MLRGAALLVLAVVGFAGQKPAVQTGKLLDFTEENYKAGLFAQEGCVNRDYSVDAADRILVIRHQTCMPHRDPALKLVIGREVQYVLDDRRDRAGLLDPKGKIHWYRLFKVIDKAAVGK